jgi:hypothetical protein
VIPSEATPFPPNRRGPKGGVVVAISMLRRNITVNQIGLNPRASTIGINIGKVIIMIGTTLTNIPNIPNTAIHANDDKKGIETGTGSDCDQSTTGTGEGKNLTESGNSLDDLKYHHSYLDSISNGFFYHLPVKTAIKSCQNKV